MRYLRLLLLVTSLLAFTSCAHYSKGKDCCKEKSKHAKCKDGSCDLKKQCCKEDCSKCCETKEDCATCCGADSDCTKSCDLKKEVS